MNCTELKEFVTQKSNSSVWLVKKKISLVGVFTHLPANLAGLIFKGPKFKVECYDEVVCPSCVHTECNNMCFMRAAAVVNKINEVCNLEHGLNFT